MLTFNSANVRIVNTERAVQECVETTFNNNTNNCANCRIIIANTGIGHNLDKTAAALRKIVPNAVFVGNTCGGVIGRERVGESLHEMGIMAIGGAEEECAAAAVNNIFSENSYEKGLELAQKLKTKTPQAHTVYLICPGRDVANDLVIKAFDEVFENKVTVFGGTSSDNMKGITSYQYIIDSLTERGAFAVAFADPSLKTLTKASHGFTAYGNPLTVTKAAGNKILELDGKPALEEFVNRLGLTQKIQKARADEPAMNDVIAMGALAQELSPELAKEYGNPHILRGVLAKRNPDNAILYPVTVKEGEKLWLTRRDEKLIFSEQQKTLDLIKEQLTNHKPAAVFQTDCVARGKLLFNKIMKDEITAMMQTALSCEDIIPPWLGMYGFGEYAKLGGENAYHNYSSSLLVLYRL